MKLAKLNAAIDAAPAVKGHTFFGLVEIKKGDLKARLAEHFTGGRSQETGLCLNAEGVICRDPAVGEANR